jgi:hypothetical protein
MGEDRLAPRIVEDRDAVIRPGDRDPAGDQPVELVDMPLQRAPCLAGRSTEKGSWLAGAIATIEATKIPAESSSSTTNEATASRSRRRRRPEES